MAERSETPARREAVQRVQIGLIGLGAVLLVVTFANIVVKAVRPEAAQTLVATGQQPAAGSANATGDQAEPLADLGVTPKTDQSSAVSPSVPDLQPDPRLSRPMDQDPKKAGAQQR